jgi:5-methylcytosine-specific restriction endonuclease McrA
MRNVERFDEPAVLSRNGRRWTEELLDAIAEAKRTNGKVSPKFWHRYNHADVKIRLKRMFNGLCCYCESRVGDVAHEPIEHRKPKATFPEMTFVWANLHLACPRCNGAKGDKWDQVNEILDAVDDIPISIHLSYEWTRVAVIRYPLTDRGAVTIEHADLNGEHLLRPRQEIFNEAYRTVRAVRIMEREEGDSPRVRVAKNELRRWFSGEHGSLIEFVAKDILSMI